MALARRREDETENLEVTHWDERDWIVTLPSGLPILIRHEMGGFFPEIEVTDPDALFEQEKAAFKAMLPRLKHQYPGSYVAIHNGAVSVVGATEAEVVRNFFEQFGDTHVYVGYIGEAPPDTYQVSPISFE